MALAVPEAHLREALQAVETLYRTPPNTPRTAMDDADKLLRQLTSKPQEAIALATNILALSPAVITNHNLPVINAQFNNQTMIPIEAAWFASSALYWVALRDFRDLNREERSFLREMLYVGLLALKPVSSEEQNWLVIAKVRLQLARALAACAVQASKEEWENPVQDLIHQLVQTDKMAVLLDFLTAIPEEVEEAEDFYFSSEHRLSALSKVESQVENVLGLMQSYLVHLGDWSAPVSSIQEKDLRSVGLRCLRSWMRVAAEMRTVGDPESWAATPLLQICFQSLQQERIFEVAVHCILQFVSLSSDVTKFHRLMQILIVNIFQLRPIYEEAVRNNNGAIESGLCRLFVQVGECYSHFLISILSNPDSQSEYAKLALDIIELVLMCAANEDFEICTLTFNFWYIVTEDVMKLEDSRSRECFLNRTKDYWMYLLQSIEKLLRFPDDCDYHDPEELDNYQNYRYDATNVLQDVMTIFPPQPVFQLIYGKYQALSPSSSWQDRELLLYMVRAIHRSVPQNDRQFLSPIIESIPQLVIDSSTQKQMPMISKTALALLGKYGTWFDVNPHYLDGVLQFILTDLLDGSFPSYVNAAASDALTHLSGSIPHQLAVDSRLELLFSAYEQFVSAYFLAPEHTKLPHPDDQLAFLTALAEVVSACSEEKNTVSLIRFMSPIAAAISEIVQIALSGQVNQIHVTQLSRMLDQLAHFFKNHQARGGSDSVYSIPESHPAIPVIVEFWKVSEKVFDYFMQDESMMENLCRFWKYLIRDFSKSFPVELVLYPLLSKAVNLFSRIHYSCFLYIASVCVGEFGTSSDKFVSLFSNLFNVLCEQTFRVLNSPNQFADHPRVAEDFFGLMLKYLNYCKGIILNSPLLCSVFQCGVVGFHNFEQKSHESIMRFFRQFFELGTLESSRKNEESALACRPLLEKALNSDTNAYALTQAIVEALMGKLPRTYIREVCDVLEAAVSFNREIFISNIREALSRAHGTDEVKQAFFQNYVSAQNKRDRVSVAFEFHRYFKSSRT